MSRAKKEVASEGQVPAQQEAAVNSLPFFIEQLLRELSKETINKNKTVKEFKGDTKKLSDRLQALELKQQQPHPQLEVLVHMRRSPVSEPSAPTRLGGRRSPRLNSSCDRQHRHRTGRHRFLTGAAAAATTAAAVVPTTATFIPTSTALRYPSTCSGWQTAPPYSFRGWRTGTPAPRDCWN